MYPQVLIIRNLNHILGFRIEEFLIPANPGGITELAVIVNYSEKRRFLLCRHCLYFPGAQNVLTEASTKQIKQHYAHLTCNPCLYTDTSTRLSYYRQRGQM